DYMVNHERQPGIGPLAGWRGAKGDQAGRGETNPNQLQKYIENQCFWHQNLEPNQRYFKHINKDYLDYAVSMSFLGRAEPILLQLYSEPLQAFRLAARGHGPVRAPERHRARIERYFDPLPFWYPPFEDAVAGVESFPLHAITQRPMAMYHSWGSHNAWLRQIHAANRLFVPRPLADELGIVDDDWVWLASRHGRIKAQVRLMEGVNGRTVWTWNAIGKRAGAWNLAPDAPEATRGFLLNHLIDELMPAQEDGSRYACADPVTGQAAWYDLRVSLEKAAPEEAGETWPRAAPLGQLVGMAARPRELRYGALFRRGRRA
ncbi:MAG TPA: molybdopterin oxidoreductase family protein, partial [Kiloniellales bacterium]|nr:molybdopterin oxidoreductase family protein [Kiloniellales bacterium]